MPMIRDARIFQPIRYGTANMMFFSEHCVNLDLLKDGYVMVDIGASMGQNLRFMMLHSGKHLGKYYGFEPCRAGFEYLQYWKQKYPGIVQISNSAVGGAKALKYAKFLDYTDPETHKHIGWGHLEGFVERQEFLKKEGAYAQMKQYDVGVTKFNDLSSIVREAKIDYMTIDTEGHEKEILADADKSVFDKVEQICLEIHRSDQVDYFRTVMGRNGFAFLCTFHGMTVYAAKQRPMVFNEDRNDVGVRE